MSEIGDDLLEVLEELGSKIIIHHYITNTDTTEYVDPDFEVNQVYPWTSHYVMKCDFVYTTVAVPGDLITFTTDSLNYLLVALATARFENKIISKEGVIYLCNTLVQIQRRTEVRVDYDLQVAWPIVYSGEYALFSGNIALDDLVEKKYGEFTLQRDRLYISDQLDVQVGDRIWLKESMDVSGEAREILAIENKMFAGIKICLTKEDIRE